jgi:hypothetical protein
VLLDKSVSGAVHGRGQDHYRRRTGGLGSVRPRKFRPNNLSDLLGTCTEHGFAFFCRYVL